MLLKGPKKNEERVSALFLIQHYFGNVEAQVVLLETIEKIQNQKAKFVRRETTRVSVWNVEILGRLCQVKYDKKRKEIENLVPVLAA